MSGLRAFLQPPNPQVQGSCWTQSCSICRWVTAVRRTTLRSCAPWNYSGLLENSIHWAREMVQWLKCKKPGAQFLAPKSGSSLSPITPAPGASDGLFWPQQGTALTATNSQTTVTHNTLRKFFKKILKNWIFLKKIDWTSSVVRLWESNSRAPHHSYGMLSNSLTSKP